mgnify:CR=1 FL=1
MFKVPDSILMLYHFDEVLSQLGCFAFASLKRNGDAEVFMFFVGKRLELLVNVPVCLEGRLSYEIFLPSDPSWHSNSIIEFSCPFVNKVNNEIIIAKNNFVLIF